MNAARLKAEMLFYLLVEKKYQCAVTEYSGKGVDGNADIFGFTKAGFTHEVEIKCSKADLAGEIASIKNLLRHEDAKMLGERKLAKLTKHSRYLNQSPQGEMPWGRREREVVDATFVPSRFSFLVVPELVDYALDNLIGSPYGVYKITEYPAGEYRKTTVYRISEERAPTQLHKEKVTEDIKEYLLRKTSTEVQILRAKMADPLLCTSCHDPLATRCEKCQSRMGKEARYRACMKREQKDGKDWMEAHRVCSSTQ